MNRFRRGATAQHAAVEALLSVHEDTEDHTAAVARLDADLRIEALVLSVRHQRDDAVGVMAETFRECLFANLEWSALLVRRVRGGVETQHPPILRAGENELGMIGEIIRLGCSREIAECGKNQPNDSDKTQDTARDATCDVRLRVGLLACKSR